LVRKEFWENFTKTSDNGKWNTGSMGNPYFKQKSKNLKPFWFLGRPFWEKSSGLF